ncbi:MAG TPA: hypothetical protein PKH10_02035 [bacterium]|nr:hypothetical protein [bacterium]
MNLTHHGNTRSLQRNLADALHRVLDEGLADLATTYHHHGTRYLFFGKRFGSIEGLVLVTDPRSDTIITAYRNRDFPRWIKSRIRKKNLH